MKRSTYSIFNVTKDPTGKYSGVVFIIDEDIGMSVTNDAENVVAELLAKYPNHRIVYRDTSGDWDELQHDNTQFTGFGVYRL